MQLRIYKNEDGTVEIVGRKTRASEKASLTLSQVKQADVAAAVSAVVSAVLPAQTSEPA